MSISMYQASIPLFIRALRNLATILTKAESFAAAKKIDSTVLVQARLYPDMYPLARQVQIASDMAKGCAARLAGMPPPNFEDNETTFPELHARIEKTVQFLESFTSVQIDGSEERVIQLKFGRHELKFPGQTYLLDFAIPNFYFHVNTAYGILRHNGVEIGKSDMVGRYLS